jgi:integrase
VPKALQALTGRTHLWRSLKTGDKMKAIHEARLVAADFEGLLRGDSLERPERLHIRHEAPSPPTSSVAARTQSARPETTLRDLLALFLGDPTKERSTKIRMSYENTVAIAGQVVGFDTPLAAIDRATCRRFLDLLQWLPRNPTKRFPKLTALEAAAMAKAKGLTSTLSRASINAYMTQFSVLMNYAVNEGYIDRNPARGLQVADPTHRRDRRLPFSMEQLRIIFHAPLYTGCADDEYGYATVGTARPRRARYWIPLIALFSGMRMNEICQLDTTDVRHIDGVDCFLISHRSTNGSDDKRVKTANSERFVPVHPRLTELGLMDFIASRRSGSQRKLFSELPLSTTGYYSDPFSKWFKRFVEKTGANRPKTCFHSFRHNFRDALREARIDHDIALALGGWASGSGKESVEVAEAYGRGFKVATLAEAMKLVQYPNLELSHLEPSSNWPIAR